LQKKTIYKNSIKIGLLIQPICPYGAYAVAKEKKEVIIMGGYGHGGGFALIVVLFILLIIVGAAYIC